MDQNTMGANAEAMSLTMGSNVAHVQTTVADAFTAMWGTVAHVLPTIIIAVLIFVLGWYLANFLGKLVAQGVKQLRLDKALEEAGVSHALSRGGVHVNTGEFFGALVKWFILIVTAITSFNLLGLTQVNQYLSTVLGYLPQVFAAAIILVITALIANFAGKVVVASSKAAEMQYADLAGTVARWAVWILGITTALGQLSIAGVLTDLLMTIVTGVIFAVSLALGLAFGLGGRDQAARALEKFQHNLEK